MFSQLCNLIFRIMEDTPWMRIEAVIVHYRFRSVNAFAKHIGLPHAENLYRIRNGKNGLSIRLALTICAHFPEVSRAWLLTGEGRMLPGSHEGGRFFKVAK